MVEVCECVVDQVACQEHEVSAKLVNNIYHLTQHRSGSEPAHMNVADLRDHHSVQVGRQIANRKNKSPDPKVIELAHRDRGQAQREKRRNRCRCKTEELPATPRRLISRWCGLRSVASGEESNGGID